jgi:hypothetical protein
MTKRPLERPAEPAGELYFRTPVTPEEAFQAIGRLRKEARDEIDRLIRFLDKTDDYVSRELEESADDCPQREDEDEPSLGSLSAITDQTRWAAEDHGEIDAEEEHDGREEDDPGEESDHGEEDDHGGDGAREDDEPSLGWTIDGVAGNQSGADRELQDHAPVQPQRRTRLGKGVHAAPNYCHGSRVLGLTADQQAQFNEKRRAGKPGMVQ